MTRDERQERSNAISYNLELTRKMAIKIYENLDKVAAMGCHEANDGDRDMWVFRFEEPETLYRIRLEAMAATKDDGLGYRIVLWLQRQLFKMSHLIFKRA